MSLQDLPLIKDFDAFVVSFRGIADPIGFDALFRTVDLFDLYKSEAIFTLLFRYFEVSNKFFFESVAKSSVSRQDSGV
jgi:hypothetical protein